ncbi:MAG: hypothetical protein VW397_02615, partial [Candidatus Margulisiibacteriota bacterium]
LITRARKDSVFLNRVLNDSGDGTKVISRGETDDILNLVKSELKDFQFALNISRIDYNDLCTGKDKDISDKEIIKLQQDRLDEFGPKIHSEVNIIQEEQTPVNRFNTGSILKLLLMLPLISGKPPYLSHGNVIPKPLSTQEGDRIDLALTPGNSHLDQPASIFERQIESLYPPNFEKWLNYMSHPLAWGDNISLQAVSNRFAVDIVVYSSRGAEHNTIIKPSNGKEASNTVSILHFVDAHFQELRLEGNTYRNIERSAKGDCQFASLSAALHHIGVLNDEQIKYEDNGVVKLESSFLFRNMILNEVRQNQDLYLSFMVD